jgi:Glycosyl hydrolase family 76
VLVSVVIALTATAQAALTEPVAQAADATAALPYLQLAEHGAAEAERRWRRGAWYAERLNDHDRYPLATIWGVVPLFEALDAIQLAAPTSAHRGAVETFARGAERYFDPGLRPTPGYAPYPNDRGQSRTWFDDNGWWGLAFMDGYRATHDARLLHDAERAFGFIAAQGWDPRQGGIWWNTSHPYKSGPALSSDTLLGALLYQTTHKQFYLLQVEKFLGWAEAHFLTEDDLYAQSSLSSTPTPYVEAPLVEAHQILCEQGQQASCVRARQLADASWQRFQERLTMGPQFDTIYLHWMLIYGAQAGDRRWAALAGRVAGRAQANAMTGAGLYLRAWDGTSITEHQASANMLQTEAATLELFAWLAGAG